LAEEKDVVELLIVSQQCKPLQQQQLQLMEMDYQYMVL